MLSVKGKLAYTATLIHFNCVVLRDKTERGVYLLVARILAFEQARPKMCQALYTMQILCVFIKSSWAKDIIQEE